MNRVLLSGRITKDIQLRAEQKRGKPFTRFTVAVNREMQSENSVDYIDCVAFGKVAQMLKKHARKGTRIILEGRWRCGKYTNLAGITVWSNVVWVNFVEIVDWQYDPDTDRLPPEFSRKKPLDKYPELDMDNFDEDEIESVMHEVTLDDPYMPRR